MKFLVIVEVNFSASVSEGRITVVLSGLDWRFLLGDALLLDLEGVVHCNYKQLSNAVREQTRTRRVRKE